MGVDRNRVLVAFQRGPDETVSRAEALERIFGLDSESGQGNIMKNLTWKTKYYQLQYDLYVDEFEDLANWLDELNESHCELLRSVLAGVVVVKRFDPTSTAELRQFCEIKSPDSFLVWCNTNPADEETLDRANSTIASTNANAEMVNWHCTGSINEYGEKVGVARLREIIDTHEWAEIRTAASSSAAPQLKDNLTAVVSKLQKARQQYQGLENQDEASSFAAAVAEEIAELL
ncbi:hypothetical protein HG537_0D00500 [Torulaspora globosa]|uniref:Increased recombination centers protein 6 n=1 Tax=Torulaspora globosa TaxID=48254 RepID=A0A7H9HRR0_9SACH|nr:hypothetical protein HG537_0D00500 [Torulaspora sp. CBS 2947]